MISFILSDVIGDSLELIASGPTVRETLAPHRCLDIIKKFSPDGHIPQRVVDLLEKKKVEENVRSHLGNDPRGKDIIKKFYPNGHIPPIPSWP